MTDQIYYETMYILRPDIAEDEVTNHIEKYNKLLEELGGKILDSQMRGKRRLAYQIAKHREGIYVQLSHQGDGQHIFKIEKAMRLSDDVIRYLTVKQEGPLPTPRSSSKGSNQSEKKEVDDDEEDRIKNKDSKKSLGFDKLENSDKSNADDGPVGKNIDYSSTLEDAYTNLQGLLGKDGIKGLTTQTNRLLGQQKNLMDSLKHMGPIIDDAQNTLKGFNLAGITKLFDRQKPEDSKNE